MKYIKKGHTVVLFSGDLRHIDVAEALGIKPESAGFVTLDTKEINDPIVRCHGDSMTLNLPAKAEDAQLVRILLESNL